MTRSSQHRPVSELGLVSLWRGLMRDLFEDYRPERHYMRGPGPTCRAKHRGPEMLTRDDPASCPRPPARRNANPYGRPALRAAAGCCCAHAGKTPRAYWRCCRTRTRGSRTLLD